MAAVKPSSYEEWIDTAPMDELVKGLYERFQQLSKENLELKESNTKLKENRNFMLELLKTHKHDLQGVVMLPNTIVNFQD